MKIIYTKHAQKKFVDLAKLGIIVEKKLINKIATNSLHADFGTDPPKIIVSGNLDAQHILRIVYKKEYDIITVITFYPTKKGRYSL